VLIANKVILGQKSLRDSIFLMENIPTGFGMRECRMHGLHRPHTALTGDKHPKDRHGSEDASQSQLGTYEPRLRISRIKNTFDL
jgi:hypothetical protein